MGVLPILYFAKLLSSTMISGSGKRVGFLPDQSRLVSPSTAGTAMAAVAAARNERRPMEGRKESVRFIEVDPWGGTNQRAKSPQCTGRFTDRKQKKTINHGTHEIDGKRPKKR